MSAYRHSQPMALMLAHIMHTLVTHHTTLNFGASFHAGLYPPGVAARLAHLADSVLEVQALRDDSGLVRLAADPARRAP